MAWPKDGEQVKFEFVTELFEPVGNIKAVSMLGHYKEKHGAIEWDASPDGLIVDFPKEKPCEYAHVFKIELGE